MKRHYGFYLSSFWTGCISSLGYFKQSIRALDLKDMQLPGGRVAALLDAAPDAMVLSGAAGRIKLINTQAEKLFGYSQDELLGQPLELLLPDRLRDAHAAHRATCGRAPGIRRMGSGLELLALHKEGREFPVEISLSPLETESGLLILSAVRDISARKAVQTALVEARQEAERASRAKSAFLAAASHDLRQPLQTLTLLNSALSKMAPPGSKIAEIAASQQHAIRSMSDLLNSLLDIRKLEAGAVKPEIRDCSDPAHFDGMVLVVDDDAAVADATVLFLNATGYQAIATSGLEEAQAHFANAARAPDAMICDFHLADGENGVETIEQIRRLWGRTVPAVLITGDTSAVMPDVLASVPDCHLFSKPVDSNALAALLQSLTARET